MIPAFTPDRIDALYAFLDDCPAGLFPLVVTLPTGSLQERVDALVRWRQALLSGDLPIPGKWPPASIEDPIRAAIDQLGLARYCTSRPELVDALLADVFLAFARGTLEAGIEALTNPITTAWGERVRAWHAIAEVFGDLGQLLSQGWDLSLGILQQAGWLELARLHALVERLPQFTEVVRSLGRLQQTAAGKPVAKVIFESVRRIENQPHVVRTPLATTEANGIERSGEISRMLPSEAAMLSHPLLRKLWHARRAERGLLGYRVEGSIIETHPVERVVQAAVTREVRRQERGPIILAIDTSGSMRGLPEAIAKALCLQALKTAREERRRCLVYAYGGRGEVVEHELDLSRQGFNRVLNFLGFTFGGGTDVTGVVHRILDRLRQGDWENADVLFVSDGEFAVSPDLESSIRARREMGVRFHGIQIGNRRDSGMRRICDPVHSFEDWAAAAPIAIG